MLVYRSFEELKTFLAKQAVLGKSIGLVPTMGALHEGHMSLVHSSQQKSDITICTIFVNPTQFNKKEDLVKYPRNEQRDLALLEDHACDIAFLPSVDDVYPKEYTSTFVDLKGMEIEMEGKHRPGHFDGVVQVVGRFFEEIMPHFAFFGEKDYQQLAVVNQMVKERGFDVSVEACAIIRESTGLAMSSRNERLSPQEKIDAIQISERLKWVQANFQGKSIREIQKEIELFFSVIPNMELEYFEIANVITMQRVASKEEPCRAFIVVVINNVRLLDNVSLALK